MSLRDLIRGPAPRKAAAAIAATLATDRASQVPRIAAIATVALGQPPKSIPPSPAVARIATVAAASPLHAEPAAWGTDDWRAFYDERAGILEHDAGMRRVEAEAQAFEATVAEWLNQHSARSEPVICYACGENGEREPLLPYYAGIRHVWLHGGCWPSWWESRRAKAAAALKALGIKTEPSL